ncbi:hypothetical protein ANRL1_01945 [Anaerolineae bacterium]|nr:hypothetical protein ANRL1_01945 [Anaerolineae bacterium]
MWFNPIITELLRSPFHAFISKNMMLITFTGRKSGKSFTTPTNYVRDGEDLFVISYRHRTWWKNLRDGAPVTMRLAGKDCAGIGQVFEDDRSVTDNLLAYLEKVPQVAKYMQVRLDPAGLPELEDVARAARDKVVVRIQVDRKEA